ncbi:unnamed protein product [Closterium sp. NIES-65]|nr:unnamed protein product [Closterium sp. NIES-65]
MSPLAYRRGLREDVCALAEGRLIGELTAAGHEIPPGNEIRKPHEAEVIGDEVEDKEWRAEMAERMHRLDVRNEGQALAIAKLERQLHELMLSRAPQHGIDGEAAGKGHGNEAGDGGTGEQVVRAVAIAPNPAGHAAAQNTAPHPHVIPTPPDVAPSMAQQATDPHAHQVPPSEENAQASVAGMTDSQHSLSMPTAPNDPNPPSHGSALASEQVTGAADGIIDAFLGQATQ